VTDISKYFDRAPLNTGCT